MMFRVRLPLRYTTGALLTVGLPLALALVVGGCSKNEPAPAAAAEAAPKEPTPNKPSPSGEKVAPPPRAARAHAPETITTEHAVLTVSDLELGVGERAMASIELQPAGAWKLNVDYPTRIVTRGLTVVDAAGSDFRNGAEGLQMTAGGLRLDIPVTGQAVGEDRMQATIRYGVCSESTCVAQKADVSFRVAVR